MNTAGNILDAALAWHAAGCSVLPVKANGSKQPAVNWARHQQHAASPEQLAAWFTGDIPYGVGVICGAISGNLEMIEFEGRAVTESLPAAMAAAMAAHGQDELWRAVTGGYAEMTPSGGLHLYYRVKGRARRNTKLARRPATPAELAGNPADKTKVLIETRGQGGYTVTAPTGGHCHATGRPWTALLGTPRTIPAITAEQRDTLHAIAALHDAMPAHTPEPPGNAKPGTPGDGALRPGDDYNDRTAWDDILAPHGWTRMWRIGDGWGWRRPGKTERAISATTGTSRDGADRLYVFTTSTELPTERPLNKFAAHAHLDHGGNYAAAARALRLHGYGTPTPSDEPPGRPPVVIDMHTRTPVDGATALAPEPAPARGDTTTDLANARRMAQRHHHQLRYIPAHKQWLRWTGTHWLPCEGDAEAIQAAIDTIEAIDPADEELGKHRRKSQSHNALTHMVDLARTDPLICMRAEQLDPDPYLLNTPSGAVDLRTGTARPNNPDDMCTHITGAPYDPDAACTRFLAFLAETFRDQELAGYVQRLVGYSAAGVVLHHILPFLHGGGANGKSAFMNIVMKTLGGYASAAAPNFLVETGREDLSLVAGLQGQRMVVASEVSPRARFAEQRVKDLTGGDALRARFLYANAFEFRPTHTLWMMGNHQPRVEAGGESFWRRLRLIPFAHTVPPEDRIENLDGQIAAAEGPGVLAWIVRGAVDVLAGGLRDPQPVLDATRQYAEEEDSLALFVGEACVRGPSAGAGRLRTNTKVARDAYERWCRTEGEHPMPPQAFGRELRSRFAVTAERSNGQRFYAGIALRAGEEPSLDGVDEADPRLVPWEQR